MCTLTAEEELAAAPSMGANEFVDIAEPHDASSDLAFVVIAVDPPALVPAKLAVEVEAIGGTEDGETVKREWKIECLIYEGTSHS